MEDGRAEARPQKSNARNDAPFRVLGNVAEQLHSLRFTA
jgi:hypothetical protein